MIKCDQCVHICALRCNFLSLFPRFLVYKHCAVPSEVLQSAMLDVQKKTDPPRKRPHRLCTTKRSSLLQFLIILILLKLAQTGSAASLISSWHKNQNDSTKHAKKTPNQWPSITNQQPVATNMTIQSCHRLNTTTHKQNQTINWLTTAFPHVFPPLHGKEALVLEETWRNLLYSQTLYERSRKIAQAPKIQVAGSSGAPHHEHSWCHDASLAQSNHLLSDRGKPHRPQRSSSWIFCGCIMHQTKEHIMLGWEAIWVEHSTCQNGILPKELQHVTTLN